jgi:hypothetical protein
MFMNCEESPLHRAIFLSTSNPKELTKKEHGQSRASKRDLNESNRYDAAGFFN